MSALEAVLRRHSHSKVTEDAPTRLQLLPFVEAAATVADHSGLKPWRLIELRGDARVRLGAAFAEASGAELFRSGAKFDSGSGWPSFFESVNPDAVELKTDSSLGMVRTEVLCGTCGSHLGHLFDDAYQTPTGDRYCMNSLSLDFKEN